MSGKVEKVWVKTTVDSSYVVNTKCWRGECAEFTAHNSTVLKSLEVRDASAEWQLAVETHLKQVREFASGKINGSALTVSKISTEVCAKVDNGRTECQPLTAGNVVPEEATVAALFRGAELTVAVLGPVGSDAATAKQETPATKPVKDGTQATPGSTLQKAPVVWPRNVPYDATDPKSRPPRNVQWEIEP